MSVPASLRNPLVPVAVVALSLLSWAVVEGLTPEESPTVLLEGLSRAPATTPSDWANAADIVVAAQVTHETVAAADSAAVAGEGAQLVGRTVSIAVDDFLWSATNTQPAPRTLQLDAVGVFKDEDGDTVRQYAHPGASRLEAGHHYLLALTWMESQCTEEDQGPAGWQLIGIGAAIPIDGQVVGRGELEGTTVTPDEARARATPGSVVAEFAGKSPEEVAAAVASAERGPRDGPQRSSRHCP